LTVLANDTGQAGKKRKERRMLKAVERGSWPKRGCMRKLSAVVGFEEEMEGDAPRLLAPPALLRIIF
jgi:hypothetical protein